MLREQKKLIERMHRLLDIFLTVLSFAGAYFIKKEILPVPFRGLLDEPDYSILILMIIIIWPISFKLFGFYSPYRKQTFGHIFLKIIKAVVTNFLFLIMLMYLFKITDISRIMMSIFILLNVLLLCLSKNFIYRTLTHFRAKGFNLRNTLLVGSKEGAIEVIDAIGEHRENGYRIIGCLEVEKDKIGKSVKNGIKVIDTIESMERILLEEIVDVLIFAMPLKKIKNIEHYISLAEDMGVSIRILPQWHIRQLGYKPNIGSLQFETFLGIPTMALMTTPKDHQSLLIKNIIDYIIASTSIVLCLPVFILASITIKFSSKGPIFFKQERLGLNGRKFKFYKFRTMVVNAEEIQSALKEENEADGPAFKIKKDPRIIPIIGTFLRKTSLDELPQMINVIKGEMSIVGPRPPIPSEVKKYDNWHRRRLSMKPGITCIWQVTPNRNKLKFHDWIKMDLDYIDRWSLKLDFEILHKTIYAVLKAEGW